MRALSSGELRGIRDNRNTWRITSEDVDAWCEQRMDSDRSVPSDTPGQAPVTSADTPQTLARLAVSEARLADALERIDDLQKERDEWRAQAQALIDRPSFITRLLRGMNRA